MMTNGTGAEVYQLHVWLRHISPMIWRRLLLCSDSRIANLHFTLLIAFGWSDDHSNRFHIHGQDYGVYHDGGISFSSNANKVRLSNIKFRKNERFLYEYDLSDCWQHEVRVVACLAPEDKRLYPCCIGGQRRAPPEGCGGSLSFMDRRDEVPLRLDELLEEIRDYLESNNLEAIRDLAEDIEELHEWFILDRFDRRPYQ